MTTEDKTTARSAGAGKRHGRVHGILNDYTGGRLRMQLTPERFGEIWKDIVSGSEPAPRYYIMALVSSLIAGLGLVADSTGVVIGAMLVAPLMTPIFGISLGLVHGNARLLRKALRAEVIGALVAMAMGYLVGWLLTLLEPSIQSTHEMLARTTPNLLDLFVALLAGFAGAYAIIDKNISPALPGVAIATAIVPPLVNSGLCLAYGLYSGAMGSFLLFSANFLSIHLVSALLFFRAGLGHDYGIEAKGSVMKRFGPSVAVFIAIAVTFGYFLVNIMDERETRNTIFTILSEELADYAATGIDGLVLSRSGDDLNILVRIYATGEFDPDQVKQIEERVEGALGIEASLMVRAIKTADISARGANLLGTDKTPEGFLTDESASFRVRLVRMAEQLSREYLAGFAGMEFVRADYLRLPRKDGIDIVVSGIRSPTREEIRTLEDRIRRESGVRDLTVLVRFIYENLLTADGPFRYAWRSYGDIGPERQAANEKGRALIVEAFKGRETLLLTGVNGLVQDGRHIFLAEAEGPGVYSRKDLVRLQDRLRAQIGETTLYVWLNHGVVQTDGGLVPYNLLLKRRMADLDDETRRYFKDMVKSMR